MFGNTVRLYCYERSLRLYYPQKTKLALNFMEKLLEVMRHIQTKISLSVVYCPQHEDYCARSEILWRLFMNRVICENTALKLVKELHIYA